MKKAWSLGMSIIKSVLWHRKQELGTNEGLEAVVKRIIECLNLTPVSDMVLFERAMQAAMGYDAKHDDIHTLGQLTMGAVCFAQTAFTQINSAKPLPGCFRHKDWPWEPSSFHAEQDPVGNLVKAAAMLIAEAERITRTRGEQQEPAAPRDDLFLAEQIGAGIDLAIKRDKIGRFLAAVSGYLQAVLCEARPERLNEALKDVESFDQGQSPAMVEVQKSVVALVRAEMALLNDPAYHDLLASAADVRNSEGGADKP